MMTISFVVAWYYNVVMAWVIYYFVHSFYPKIPWASCDNWWNTDQCIISHKDRPVQNESSLLMNQSVTASVINQSEALYPNNASHPNSTYNTAAFEFWQYVYISFCRGITTFLKSNGTRPRRGPRDITFQERRDTSTLTYLKSTFTREFLKDLLDSGYMLLMMNMFLPLYIRTYLKVSDRTKIVILIFSLTVNFLVSSVIRA
jgi:hypothetical protein